MTVRGKEGAGFFFPVPDPNWVRRWRWQRNFVYKMHKNEHRSNGSFAGTRLICLISPSSCISSSELLEPSFLRLSPTPDKSREADMRPKPLSSEASFSVMSRSILFPAALACGPKRQSSLLPPNVTAATQRDIRVHALQQRADESPGATSRRNGLCVPEHRCTSTPGQTNTGNH